MHFFFLSTLLLTGVSLAQSLAQTPPSARPAPPVSRSAAYANTDLTQEAIQQAITRAPAHTTVRLAPGTYTLTSTLIIEAKQGLTLSGGGWVTLTGPLNTFIRLSGPLTSLRLTGIRFVSTYSSADPARIDGILTTDQSVRGDGYEVDHCYFTAPTANINAICWVPVDGRKGKPTNHHVFRHINIHHNLIENMGSCGIELLNQNLDVYRVQGLTISDNIIRNCGRKDTYGMGISLSGAMEQVVVARNTVVQCKPFGIEIINCRAVQVTANTIRSTIAGAAGISINASPDDNGHSVINERVTVTGNTVTVAYSPIQAADVGRMTVSGNTFSNLKSSDLSNGSNRFVRCAGGVFIRNKVVSSSYNCLTINNSPNWQISRNTFSNRLMASGEHSYQPLWFYGSGSRGSIVSGNTYEKNKALRDTQGFVWESDGATNNHWSDVGGGR